MNTPELRIVEVEKLYDPAVPSWPEGPNFNLQGGTGEFLIALPSPTQREAARMGHAPVRMGLAVLEGAIFFIYDCLGFYTAEAPYSWHLLPEPARVLPDPLIGHQRIPVLTVLIDATTGLVKAWRLITMSPRVSRAFIRAVLDQAAQPFDPDRYRDTVRRVYERYGTPDIVRMAMLDVAGTEDT